MAWSTLSGAGDLLHPDLQLVDNDVTVQLQWLVSVACLR